MAIPILPSPLGNILGNISQGLGTGLGQGLSTYSQQKFQDLAERKKSERTFRTLAPLVGKETAQLISVLPEKLQMALLQNPDLEFNLGGSSVQGNQQGNIISRNIPLGVEQNKQQPDNSQQQQGEIFTRLLQALNSPYETGKLINQTGLERVLNNPKQPQSPIDIQKTPARTKEEILAQRETNGQKTLKGLFATPQQRQQQKLLELKERKEQRDIAKQEREELHKAKLEANEETKDLYKKISDDNDFADFSDVRIKKMENLIKKGGLPFSGFYSALKNLEEHVPSTLGAAAGGTAGAFIGGPAGAAIGGALGGLISPVASILRSVQNLTSPNTEEFVKLSNEFIKGAKSLFGNRITNDELKAYLATLPTLANTDQGKLAIIKNMSIANKVAKLKYKTMKEIIKENDGNRPADLAFQIEERAKPGIDKLVDEFTTVS